MRPVTILGGLLMVIAMTVPSWAYEIDPELGLVPLDAYVQQYKNGDQQGALSALEAESTLLMERFADPVAPWAEESPTDEALAAKSLVLVNAATMQLIACFLESGLLDDPEQEGPCPHQETYPWPEHISFISGALAQSFVGEAFESRPTGFPSPMNPSIRTRLMFTGIHESRAAALCSFYLALDGFGAARRLRNQLMDQTGSKLQEQARFVRERNDGLPDSQALLSTDGSRSFHRACNDRYRTASDDGPVMAYEAVLAMMTEEYDAGVHAAVAALSSPLPLATTNPYEHPLLWGLALQHQVSPGTDDPLLNHVAAQVGGELGEETASIIALYQGALPDDDTLNAFIIKFENACSGVACDYFLATYLERLGFQHEAGVVHRRGLEQCGETRSVICSALRSLAN